MKITQLDSVCGAEVTDFDLAAPWVESPDELKAIQDAFRARHLLVFRGSKLAPLDQVALIEALGLVADEWGDGRKFGLLSNELPGAPNQGQYNAYLFHSDLIWKEQPVAAISLFAIAVPEEPAPTLFASSANAARVIPSELRNLLRGQRAIFGTIRATGDRRYRMEDESADSPRAVQPVLYEDPVSGQTCLVVDSLFMDKLEGWDPEASEELRTELHKYLYDPSNIYRHDWAVGDLVVWNNIALQHARPELPGVGERTHRRVSGTIDARAARWDSTFKE